MRRSQRAVHLAVLRPGLRRTVLVLHEHPHGSSLAPDPSADDLEGRRFCLATPDPGQGFLHSEQ